jgi:hypothetical protein
MNGGRPCWPNNQLKAGGSACEYIWLLIDIDLRQAAINAHTRLRELRHPASDRISFLFMSVFRSIKSKHVNKDHLKKACSTATSGLHTTLQIAKEAAGHAGVPGLQTGITCLLFVLDVIKVHRDRVLRVYSFWWRLMQQTSQNADDIQKLGKQIEELNRVLEKSKSEGTFSPAVIERVDRLFVWVISHRNELVCTVRPPAVHRMHPWKNYTR